MRDKIDELLASARIDSALLRTHEWNIDPNFYYAAGISKKRELSSFLVLRRGKKPLVLASVLEYGALRRFGHLDVRRFTSEAELIALLKASLGRKVGINYSYYSLNAFKRLKKLGKSFVDVSPHLEKAREVKTRAEIRKLAEAAAIAEEILGEVPSLFKKGMTERELSFALDILAQRNAEGISFPTIVASGPHAAVPHHITGNTTIATGVLLIDFGVLFEGYCSDLTRCYAAGKAEKETRAYEIVYRAQQAALRHVKPRLRASASFNAANDILKHELGQPLIHSLGHGIGVQVHDYPSRLAADSSYMLEKNMCVTVEPGFYKDGAFGIRIEDDVVVGARALSRAPKELVRI